MSGSQELRNRTSKTCDIALNTELPPPPYVEDSYFHHLVERLFQRSPQILSIDTKDSNSSPVREKDVRGKESQDHPPWNSVILLTSLIVCGVIGYRLFGAHPATFSKKAVRTLRTHFRTETDLAECQRVHRGREHARFYGVKSDNMDFILGQRPNPHDADPTLDQRASLDIVDFTVDQSSNSSSSVLRRRKPETTRPVPKASGVGAGSQLNFAYLESRPAVASGRDIGKELRSNKRCARCRAMRMIVLI